MTANWGQVPEKTRSRGRPEVPAGDAPAAHAPAAHAPAASLNTRREILISGGRLALVAGTVAVIGPLMTACGEAVTPATTATEVPPRLPEDAPDFDRLNSLIQLEHREIALANETLAGGRLDPREAGYVSSIRDHHRFHVDSLAELVSRLGGRPGSSRPRYSLPTPLGDARRALEVLAKNEEAMVAGYRNAIAAVTAMGIGSLLISNLFAEATHFAGLRAISGAPIEIRAFA